MNIYSTRSINIISLVITIIIFLISNFVIKIFSEDNFQSIKFPDKKVEENIIPSEADIKENEEKQYNWYIEIKSISLKAPIEETTNTDVLSHYVGHFEETSTRETEI